VALALERAEKAIARTERVEAAIHEGVPAILRGHVLLAVPLTLEVIPIGFHLCDARLDVVQATPTRERERAPRMTTHLHDAILGDAAS